MSSQYFQHRFVSNSDLKALNRRLNPSDIPDPDNLEEIFTLGTLIHQILLEPHKADRSHPDIELAKDMAATFMKDPICRQFLMMPDFRREHEFYRSDLFGVPSRAKADGDSKIVCSGLEYKGLKVGSRKDFMEAIFRLDYDQGIAWYLDTTKFDRFLIVGVSKLHPDRIFKELVDRNHRIYEIGKKKAEVSALQWKEFFGDNARGVEIVESF